MNSDVTDALDRAGLSATLVSIAYTLDRDPLLRGARAGSAEHLAEVVYRLQRIAETDDRLAAGGPDARGVPDRRDQDLAHAAGRLLLAIRERLSERHGDGQRGELESVARRLVGIE